MSTGYLQQKPYITREKPAHENLSLSQQVTQAFHAQDEGIQKDHYEVFIWHLNTTHQVFAALSSVLCKRDLHSSCLNCASI